MQRLFVYGSLGPGRPNEHILASLGGVWEKAVIRGYLRNQGWGAKLGCPGLVLDEAGEWIEGFLFSSENLREYWGKLDSSKGRSIGE